MLLLQDIMYETALFSMLLIMPSMAKDLCRAGAFQKPRRGARCVAENYTTITHVPQHLCTHACMQKNCSLINYNHEKHYCQLGFGGCQMVIVDPEFTVTTSSFPPVCQLLTLSTCIQWVPVTEVQDDKAIRCEPRSPYRVGRLVLQTDILVGKFDSTETKAWKEGAYYSNANETEVMQLQPGCSANWVAYTPGDPFPPCTVIGGYLGDPYTGTPVIRGLTSDGDSYRCGYYNSNTQLGYMIVGGPEVATEMDILVLAWVSLWNTTHALIVWRQSTHCWKTHILYHTKNGCLNIMGYGLQLWPIMLSDIAFGFVQHE